MPVRDFELPALLLDLAEQARVLDRDHRLIGEGLQQRDLLLGERPRAVAPDADARRVAPLPQQRREDDRLEADRLAAAPHVPGSLAALDVGKWTTLAVEHAGPVPLSPVERIGKICSNSSRFSPW